MQKQVDCLGSKGLNIQIQNNKKIYRKRASTYLYKYLIDYLKKLSAYLEIPVIDYKFVDEDTEYYIESECYDDKIDFDEILLTPIQYSDIVEGIYMLKEYFFKYDNGREIYNDFIKQILLALLINDADRTMDNMKIYRKNNKLILSPYLDIHMMMNADGVEPVFIDDFYFTEEKYEKVKKQYSSEDYLPYVCWMRDFQIEFKNWYSRAFIQAMIGEHKVDEVWQIIYEEIEDKEIFYKILNLELDELIDKNNFQENAYLMISTQFEISKQAVKSLLKNKNKSPQNSLDFSK